MKKKEEKIKQNAMDPFTAASFFALAENAPDIICRFDRNYYHLYVNPALEKITGVPTTTFIGKTTHEVGMTPEFADFWKMHINHVFTTEKPNMFEFNFPTPLGMKYFQSSIVPEFDTKGNIISVLSISRDITEIREQEKEKDAFLAMVTHELKTPITSAKLHSQLLEKKLISLGDKKNAHHVTKINTQLNRLTKLISDLLDATRIGVGKMQFQERIFDFRDLLKDVINETKDITTTHPIILEESSSIVVKGDKDRIGQVLLNLLSNAIKYSPDSLPVVISTRIEEEQVICCVKDLGFGIPKEKQRKLFKKFSRLTEANNADTPGLGLGLYISAEIIKQQGGKIWVESDKDRGATFCFSLPIQKEERD